MNNEMNINPSVDGQQDPLVKFDLYPWELEHIQISVMQLGFRG